MSSSEEETFRDQLGNEIKLTKKSLYIEEVKSLLVASCFAFNISCLVSMSFSMVSLLNVVVVWWCMKQFKPTVKNQILFCERIKLLTKTKNEKVWTQRDK